MTAKTPLSRTSAPYNSAAVGGDWAAVSASRPTGRRLRGMLTFTADMRYVEVRIHRNVPRFVSEVRRRGTDVENRAAMAAGIGMFGTYTVDENGEFAGDRVEGSTFSNWIGSVRTRKELRITVDGGDRMTEHLRRPHGTRGIIVMECVR